MNTFTKLGAAAALIAVFAGASAGETTIEEIVVIGKRPFEALPRIEIEKPVLPRVQIEPLAPVIELPAIEVASLGLNLG